MCKWAAFKAIKNLKNGDKLEIRAVQDGCKPSDVFTHEVRVTAKSLTRGRSARYILFVGSFNLGQQLSGAMSLVSGSCRLESTWRLYVQGQEVELGETPNSNVTSQNTWNTGITAEKPPNVSRPYLW